MRRSIAMVYLRAHGINARYLTDGLTGLVENLRGDAARDYINAQQSLRKNHPTEQYDQRLPGRY